MIVNKISNTVPDKPGCYIYYNGNGEVIYVGKAKKLKKRMMSYFNRSQNLKTTRLIQDIVDFDIIITQTEKEALILENNLIKENNPKYNILLKDDKTFPYIVITKEEHPRLIKLRNHKVKGKYYGPFTSSTFANEVINYLNQITILRKCVKLPKIECIYYHLGQCYAPCIKDFSANEVMEFEKTTKEYLQNNMAKLKIFVDQQMKDAVQSLNFEQAAKSRDFLLLLKKNQESQFAELKNDENTHILDYYSDEDWISIAILTIQGGKLVNIHRGILENTNIVDDVASYYYRYFTNNKFVVHKLITNHDEVNEKLKSVITINVQRSSNVQYDEILKLATENSAEYFKMKKDEIIKKFFEEQNQGYLELQKISKSSLNIIEMYDISHFGGENQVAAKVSLVNGKKMTNRYRKYKINSQSSADDYSAMREVLTRRLSKGIVEEDLPDLIIVDGGKGHVGVAKDVLEMLGLEKLKLIGLVKDSKHKTRAIVNKDFNEMTLKENTALYRFLYSIQEEVHRFAINYQRLRADKTMFTSILDDIEGLGTIRIKKIRERYPTIDQLKQATEVEFIELKIPLGILLKIKEKLDRM